MLPNGTMVGWTPTYGNWGGEGYSAGEALADPNARLTTLQKSVKPYDNLDAIFKQHDLDYDSATDSLTQEEYWAKILKADEALINSIRSLDKSTISEEGRDYANKAVPLFQKKILIDTFRLSQHTSYKMLNNSTNHNFNWAIYWQPIPPGHRDPLALDLDGDGIETIGANGTVLFDSDSDGVRTGTGWLTPDDGFLVLDRNGNGTIDNGGELFGIDTILANGQKAADGFAALGDLDSNHDGHFDSQDIRFADVRIWRDLNQDGISKTSELTTLAQNNIASINLTAQIDDTQLAGGMQSATATYVRLDGSFGEVDGGGFIPTVANLDLSQNPFYREFTDPVPLVPQALALPNLHGSGMVRDLREAASLSPTLAAIAGSLTGMTRGQMISTLDSLIEEWAATSPMKTSAEQAAENGTELRYFYSSYVSDQPLATFGSTKLVNILEKFNNTQFVSMMGRFAYNIYGQQVAFSHSSVNSQYYEYEQDYTDVMLSPTQAYYIETSYRKLKESIYDGLVIEMRLKPYLDLLSVDFSQNSYYIDFTNLNAKLDTLWQSDPINGLTDLAELNSYFGNALTPLNWNGFDKLKSWVSQATSDPANALALDELRIRYDVFSIVFDNHKSDVIMASNGESYIDAGDGNDIVFGGSGADYLGGDAGNDILISGTGNETLAGGTGNDVYIFSRGGGDDIIVDYDQTEKNTDIIKFTEDINPANITVWRDSSNLYLSIDGNGGKIQITEFFISPNYQIEAVYFADGTIWDASILGKAKFLGTVGDDSISATVNDDTIEGLAGDDNLSGDAGNDVLDGGAGNDSLDGGHGNDTYLFGRGSGIDLISDYDLTAGNLDVIKFATDIAPADISLYRDTSDLFISINGTDDKITVQGWFNATANRIEEIHFPDGTVWNQSLLQNAVFIGTSGDDSLFGSTGNDTFSARQGNDTITGDTGNDTYLFGRGDGQDTISDYDATAGNVDVIKLAAGIVASDITLSRDGDNLKLVINGTSDAIAVENWFSDPGNRIEEIHFADGMVWDTSTLLAAKIMGTAGDDNLTGSSSNDTLEGLAGNDTLDGGTGNDTYLFARGDGQDTISDYDATSGNSDTIKLAAGIAVADVSLWRDASNLYLGINGSADQITIQSWFDGTAYRVEKVQFADGTVWNASTLAAAKFGGTSGNDFLNGTTGNDSLAGFGGNDSLYADSGSDTLDGGTGNDLLDGGAGNDIYIFGRGYGLDQIAETSGSDTIRLLSDVSPADVLVSRDDTHLYLSIAGTSDKLTVANWYGDSNARIEQVQFTDGTTWNSAALLAKVNQATANGDTYWGTIGNDTFDGLAGDDQLFGKDGNDTLTGGSGNDLLDGGTGTDALRGASGDDTYVVDNIADVITENAGEGTDSVRSSVTWTLGANVENLTLTGAAAINGSGNTLDNVITGNDGDNVLDGGAGNDTLAGGLGNDTYVLDNAADVVIENASAGTDTVQAGFSYTLGANLEKLTLTGTAAIDGTGNELANTITGNAAANTLIGGAGNDSLSGGAGNDILDGGVGNDSLNGGAGLDSMTGGLGNDTYTVDNIGDVVVENADEGIDKVNSSISYVLGANLENLTLTGSAAINATGNALDNILTGNTGANQLSGGLGNDTYGVDNVGDTIIENVGEGNDTVQSSITWTLGANLEALSLTGTAAINGTGNAANNVISGNDAANILDGGAGNDSLAGGLGDDTYVLDNAADVVTENANAGTDTVQVGFNFTLGANLENLTITGTLAANGFGNSLANVLTGNTAANYLWGGLGADTLNGGAGNDILQGADDVDTLTDTVGNNLLDGGIGNDILTAGSGNDLLIGGAGNDTITTGSGADVIAFNRGDGKDTIKLSTGADNTLTLGGGIRYSDLVFHKSANNLVLDTGNGESLTFQNWYTATANRSVLTLQVIAEASNDYDAASSDTLRNQKIQTFDFAALTSKFDTALAATPTLTAWNLNDALLSAHLAGSDSAALGGDLAYQFGKNASLAGIGVSAGQDVLAAASFGSQAQTLRPWATVNSGVAQLS